MKSHILVVDDEPVARQSLTDILRLEGYTVNSVPNGQAAVLMLNRDTSGEREVALDWGDIRPSRVLACETLTGPDLKAFNTFEQPRKVAPQRLDAPAAAGRMTFTLPAGSYSVAHLAVGS